MSDYLLVLDGGPCDGAYSTAYAPPALNAVLDAIDGTTDVLDAPADVPRATEVLHRYERRQGRFGHICGKSGCTTEMHYRYLGPVDDAGHCKAMTDTESERLAHEAEGRRARRTIREMQMDRIGMTVIK